MASIQPEFRESGYFMDVYQNAPRRQESEYEFTKLADLAEQLPLLEEKSSDYHLAPLRALRPVVASWSNYSYYDPKEEKNLARDDPSIVRANLISQKELLRRVQNLKGGYFIPTIINQQLYFVRSNDDDLRTADESPSMTDVRAFTEEDDGYVYTARSPSMKKSEEALRTAVNSQALTSSGERYYDTAVSGSSVSEGLRTCASSEARTAVSFRSDCPTSGVRTAKSFSSQSSAPRTAVSLRSDSPTSDVSTAKSFATEHTATDRDRSVSSGYDAFSEVSDTHTAREASEADLVLLEQNRLRQMGYELPSQLNTRLLPRANASVTETNAQGLAKTPEAFDGKVSEYCRTLGRKASTHTVTAISDSVATAVSEESSQIDI